MTAEVVIMNRRAIALAADSALTVPTYENGEQKEKYYTGSNKVFELSNSNPVGIMIFNLSDLNGVPWELIIKSYRENIIPPSIRALSDYADGLFSYIQHHKELFQEERLRERFLNYHCLHVFVRIWSAIENDSRLASSADRDADRLTVLGEIERTVTAKAMPSHFSATIVSEIWTHCEQSLTERIQEVLNNSSSSLPATLIAKLVIDTLLKDYKHFLDYTGIVVAGYGDRDFFPGYVERKCYGFLWTTLIVDPGLEKSIAAGDPGHIQPFAMDQMAETFMYGISRDVFETAQAAVRGVVSDLANKLEADVGVPSATVIASATPLFEKFFQDLIAPQIKNHHTPLAQAVGFLPVEEMASLAETLIMLESLKERMTHPSQSVGGAIDVAVITKAEGLVWVKRKHYFPGELNSRFMERQRNRLGKS